jgi:hypothetical protein
MFGRFKTNISVYLLWASCFRLKNVEPVSYSELRTKTEKGSKGVKSEFIEEGAKEEVHRGS